MDILIVLEQTNGKLHRMSREAVAAGQALAKDLNLTASALILGPNTGDSAKDTSKMALDEIISVGNPMLHRYSSEIYSSALRQIISKESPKYIIMGYTYRTRDFFPKVSASIRKPLLTDLTGYYIHEGQPVFIRQVYQAKFSIDVTPSCDPPFLLAFQSAAFQEDSVIYGNGAPTRNVSVQLDESIKVTEYDEPFQEEAGDVDLSAADVIVSVGRGIGKEENLILAQELGKILGGSIGASRPVVDAGWLPSSHQVGSSGQTVSPKLYLALGISGAIQHVVGMKGSKYIVAINKDPDAPIFELADYGVVGDILEIVPKLSEAIAEAKS